MDSKTQAKASRTRSIAPAQSPRRSVVVGLVGKGIQMSRSPTMHEAQGRHLGIDYAYRLLDVELMGPNPPSLREIVGNAELEGYSGLNVTHPFKQEILAHLDRLSDNASAIGSVNTVVLANGKRSGHNTDVWGFRQAFLKQLGKEKRDKVLLLGAGGAGAAVANALLDIGVGRLFIADPDTPRARSLTARLVERFGAGRAAVVEDVATAAAASEGLVNATPVGMVGHPGMPLSADLIGPSMWVADVVYFPIETALLKAARAKGCLTMSGEGMAILQAVRAFEHFVGVAADENTMRTAFAAHTTPAV